MAKQTKAEQIMASVEEYAKCMIQAERFTMLNKQEEAQEWIGRAVQYYLDIEDMIDKLNIYHI